MITLPELLEPVQRGAEGGRGKKTKCHGFRFRPDWSVQLVRISAKACLLARSVPAQTDLGFFQTGGSAVTTSKLPGEVNLRRNAAWKHPWRITGLTAPPADERLNRAEARTQIPARSDRVGIRTVGGGDAVFSPKYQL